MSKLKIYYRAFLRCLFLIVDVAVHFLFGLIYRSRGARVPPIADLLLFDSATELAYKIRTKKVKCIDVLESFITRIEQINPLVNCVVADRFDEARQEAKNIDKFLETGSTPVDVLAQTKPFLGVPFTTKDSIAVKGLIHSSGLVSRKNVIADEDAIAVANLKRAGAIPIALTNVPELCMWWETANNVHGRSRNPYDTNRIVGGSSGGEGCIQAAAGSAFGLGSDIGGSIRIPSLFNGVFGHKPTPFVVSNDGQFPTCKDLERMLGVGPMCRHAEDLAPTLHILAGKNASKLKLDEPVDVKNVQIFYQEDDRGSLFVSPVDKEIKALFGKISTYFSEAHKRKITKLDMKGFARSAAILFANIQTNSSPSFKEQLTNLEGTLNLPWEFLKWVVNCSNHTFIALLMSAVSENSGTTYGSPLHSKLLNEGQNLRKELLEFLGDNGVFIYPTHPTPAPYHNETIFKPMNFCYTGIINVLGLPTTHVPMGLNSEGIPIGLQVVAAPYNDRLCIAIAKELEKAFGGWLPPTK